MKAPIFFLVVHLILISTNLSGQTQVVTTPRVSPRATVSQHLGITEISISYSRPAVRGREIWGSIVPYGMSNPGWGTATSAPWRAGADENTVITFSTPVIFNGIALNAGSYALFMVILESGEVELILCSNTVSWGAYFFEENEVVARATTTWQEHQFTEYLEYEFSDFTENSVYCALNWEHKSIPFEIEVDINATVVEQLRNDLRGTARFSYIGLMEAAGWCVQHGTILEEALQWALASVNMNEQYESLKVLADAQRAMGQIEQSEITMQKALDKANVFQIHAYGRQLIAEGEGERALKVFKSNAERNPGKWPVNYGLARGYSAMGQYKEALECLEKAALECPDDINRNLIRTNMERLKKNQDIN